MVQTQYLELSNTAKRESAMQLLETLKPRESRKILFKIDSKTSFLIDRDKDTPEYRQYLIDKYKIKKL